MKEIKIRFIERGNQIKDYLIQRKTWLGWKYISYSQMAGYGDSIDILYCKDSKEELLKEVLECHYNTDKRFVTVIEYPMLKRY
jgi:hypothetical protein